ncbi:hypothetical protein U1Q18_017155 [Sarracenia purpurea var. burkii]
MSVFPDPQPHHVHRRLFVPGAPKKGSHRTNRRNEPDRSWRGIFYHTGWRSMPIQSPKQRTVHQCGGGPCCEPLRILASRDRRCRFESWELHRSFHFVDPIVDLDWRLRLRRYDRRTR